MSKPEQPAANAGDHREDDTAIGEMVESQTPVYPTTKVTVRTPPAIRMKPIGGEQYVEYTAAQLGRLHDAKALLEDATVHASDGSGDDAVTALVHLDKFLKRYPVEFTERKPKT